MPLYRLYFSVNSFKLIDAPNARAAMREAITEAKLYGCDGEEKIYLDSDQTTKTWWRSIDGKSKGTLNRKWGD